MSRQRRQVGIIGCGGMGRSHANAYRSHNQTTVVAAADLSSSARSSFAEEYDVPATYSDHEELLNAEDLDIVSICTWHSTHARITIDAAEAGVDGILCEKPMCTSLGETHDMIDAIDRNNVKLAVSHQRRFHPVNETARELITEGEIGDPKTVSASSHSGLLNMGTHMIDITRYLLDDPEPEWVIGQVERRTGRHERRQPIEDRCLGHICFEDSVRLTYESDMPDPDLGTVSLQVTGTDGVLKLDFGSAVTVVNEDGFTEYEPDTEQSRRLALVAELVDWINGERDTHRCSGAQARHTMEIMMAIYESTRTNNVVHMPLETLANPLKLMINEGVLQLDHPGKYDIRLPYSSIREDE